MLEPEVIDRIVTMTPCGNRNLFAVWPPMVSSRPTTTLVFGSRWTLCATVSTLRSSGLRPGLLGRCGDARSRVLDWPEGVTYRSHRFQR